MKTMFKNLLNLIPKSVYDAASRISSTRIQSYSILVLIYVYSLVIIVSEIHTMWTLKTYDGPSTEFLIAFGSILTHHLALLGINKNSAAEPKFGEIPHTKEENNDSENKS